MHIDQEKIRAYLTRIEFETHGDALPAPTFENLKRLQYQHLLTVPYENLDIMRGIPLSLKVADLYDKIVVRGRGGYCFELNGLFAWLLRGLGYDIVEYFARYLRDEPEGTIPMRRHRVLHVKCADGDFLADVGVGALVPLEALPLITDTELHCRGDIYKFERDDFLGYVLLHWYKSAWVQAYSFTTEPQLEADFIAANFYCEAHPQSPFHTINMVHRFTHDGRKSIDGRTFKHFTPTGVTTHTPANEAEFEALLTTEFGIKS
ncbi:MAG: arylamine N-acetyltransferase [Defluviitaleaceae bacterium]|nr:arylamine N-acetyltransferase [Defluviitaleaceae bacterium]